MGSKCENQRHQQSRSCPRGELAALRGRARSRLGLEVHVGAHSDCASLKPNRPSSFGSTCCARFLQDQSLGSVLRESRRELCRAARRTQNTRGRIRIFVRHSVIRDLRLEQFCRDRREEQASERLHRHLRHHHKDGGSCCDPCLKRRFLRRLNSRSN